METGIHKMDGIEHLRMKKKIAGIDTGIVSKLVRYLITVCINESFRGRVRYRAPP